MSGEYPGNGAPDGWFRGNGDGPGPSPEANMWRGSSPDDVTTQMPKVPAQGYPNEAAPTQQVRGHIPAPADMWGGFDGRTRQQESYQAPQPPFEPEQRPAFVPDQPPSGPFDRRPGAGSGAAPRRRHTKRWVFAGIGTAAVIGVAAVLVFDQAATPGAASTHNGAAPKPSPSGFQPTATSPAGDAEQTAAAFFTAWQGGNDAQAAALTDDPTDAQSVLAGYRTGLNLSGLTLTEQDSTAAGLVTFSVTAHVASTAVVTAGATTAPSPASTGASPSATGSAGSDSAATGTWTYTSHLTAYQKSGGWYIKWDPSLVAPNTTASVHPVALAIKPGAKSVTDAEGNSLSASSQSALQAIAALVKKNTDTGKGTAGLEIVLEDAKGKIVSGSASQLAAPVAMGVVKTTIDPELESLAATAVGKLPRSSMVVIRPSTGAILAVANTPGSGDTALTGTLAPGSDFKVVSTASLLLHGMLPQGVDTPVGCPLVVTVQGVKIHNSTDDPSSKNNSKNEDFEPPTTPFSTDFAQSCNNAFTQWWQQMADGKLAGTALNYFGLNQPWDIGLGTPGSYFHMPSDQSGSELAEEMYGQGVIQANPLSMASVAATVDMGSFHQPYLVAGLTDLKTATPLPSSVKTQLYSVMREVITSGTAAGVGFGSGVYGKTGTAEADANKDNMPNGWMIVFDPSKDIAIAGVVVDSNFGASTAGPEVNYVLQHY
ncbi:penicillin-binding transpeptidase domain-containing protein [Actinospica robiniae]|uniref:penicillin-binding transpeptidase domain-containing protein n=1 Tax=Actinospica robiniae TaxID=304901 RepID=UPI00040228B2|nr:penicillin-binding transpeptidase domain-containing protein [Actinospica robiniae]